MAEQESHHLETFNRLIPDYEVRPSALLPLWHVAGWALGAGTALLGKQAAMACTVAVETVISEHYQEQLDVLGDSEPKLRTTIAQFRAEELEHHDTGLEHGAEQTPAYGLLSAVIKTGCRAAIALAKRV
jgi:ubiquinone biosynthesis monooxygenase Coq7